MKHMLLLLPLALLVTTSPVHAQAVVIGRLIGIGTASATSSAMSSRQQKATLYVTPTTYQVHSFPQKRTPVKKLPKASKGGTEIQALELFLSGRYAAFQTDTTALLLSVAQEKEFGRLRSNLEAFDPFWNTAPYSEEMSFYRQHDDVRRRLAR